MKKVKILGLITGFCALGIISCSEKDTIAGNGTQTGNPMIAGVLYNKDGSRAVQARVKFIPVDFKPGAGLRKTLAVNDTTTTDDNGRYEIDSLPANTYNLFFSGNGNLAYRDSVTVREGYHITIESDTLKAPGSLHGKIQMQSGDNPLTVSILFLGTMVWSAPDDSTGTFDVMNLAEGDYRVRFLSILDAYTPKDTTLHVVAGKVDTLAHDIVLQYNGIPVPNGLRFTYDTLHEAVSLFWNKPTAGKPVKSYNVYRRHQDSTAFASVKNGVIDTRYTDSTGIQDQVYEYRIAAIDTEETEGVKSSGIFVCIASYLSVDALFSQCSGPYVGPFGYMSAMAFNRDGMVYVIDKSKQIVQVFDTNFVFIRQLSDTSILRGPVGIAIGGDGRVFVADAGKISSIGYISDIFMFNQTGDLEKKLSVEDTDNIDTSKGLGLNAVWNFAVDSKDRIILGALKGQRIVICDTSGAILHQWDGNTEGKGNFDITSSIATDWMDNIYIADYKNTGIYIYDSSGTFIKMLTITGKNAPVGPISGGIAIEPQTNRIFKINFSGNSLDAFDKNGNLLSHYGFDQYGWCAPTDIFINGKKVYVALSGICKVAKLTNNLP